MKLIDADKLLEALGVFTDKEQGDPHFLAAIASAREIIEKMPEAVVRLKLIDADALLKQIAEASRGKEGWYGDTWEFINTIKNAPTIDAVPVVRGGDCGWYPVEKMPVTFVVDQDIPDDICFFRETLGES